ncbi:tetratricopeptide repeat protein, partial [Thiolapillus sp.]
WKKDWSEDMKIRILLLGLLLWTGMVVAGTPVSLEDIQREWAVAKYQTAEDDQEKAFEKLVARARQRVESNPGDAAAKVWLAIALSTDAGVNGGLGALGKVKEARKYLEEAEKIDPDVLNGSVYTSLGSLYYQVPGWPIGFGNDDKAEEYLKKALKLNPDGIDPNYFYADYLLEEGKPKLALKYLENARAAPARSGRPVADRGRHQEIDAAIAKAKDMLD